MQTTFRFNTNDSEHGFVLVTAMLMLLILTIIGISALNTSNMEIQIASNDRRRKEVFSHADGGTQLGIRLVEENLGTANGFTSLTAGVLNNTNNTILISNNSLAQNEALTLPSDATRDAAYYPEQFNAAQPNAPHTNVTASGVTQLIEGTGLQMVAGYEGKGKGTAGGGGQINYTITSQHLDASFNSEAVVQVVWRHVIGLELTGQY